MNINENFLKIESSYLFSNIAKKVKAYTKANPDKEIIRLGIGDVTRPLAPACIEAMHKAVDEMADEKTFRGYPPEYGYDFLLNAINENDYRSRGIELDNSEIFVSDGAKSDTGNIGDIFSLDRVEFVSVVRTLTQLSSDITSRKKTRSVEENDLLTLAKQRLCENYGISEREAHRKIQKMSMEQGVRLMDVARKILEED